MSAKIETVSQQVLHQDLDGTLERISEKQITTMVVKDNQPRVVILPYEIYRQWFTEREHRLRLAFQDLRAWASENAEILSGLDSVQLVRETRDR